MFYLFAAFSIFFQAAFGYENAPPIFDPKPFTTWSRTSGKSKYAYMQVPFTNADGSSDSVNMYRVDLVGTTYERGISYFNLT